MSASTTFGAFINVEPSKSHTEDQSATPIVAPKKAFSKVYHSVPTPRAEEIDELQWGAQLNGPGKLNSGTATPTGTQTPRIQDLEMSRPSSPVPDDGDGGEFHAMQSFSNPPMNRYRMTTVCLLNFAGGFNDAAPGALIPYMEKYATL